MAEKAAKARAPRKARVFQRPPRTLTVKNVTEALRLSAGIRIAAARLLKVDRATITKFVDRHPEVAVAEAEIIEELADLAEGKLLEGVRRGDFSNVKFFLECKARDRGYGRSIALTGKGGGPVKLEVRNLSHLSEEQLDALERAAISLASGDGGASGTADPLPDEHSG